MAAPIEEMSEIRKCFSIKLFVVSYLLLCVSIYMYLHYTRSWSTSAPIQKTILLVTAHPDDECMVFSPTLIELAKPSRGNRIFVLCVTSGNYYGKGPLRKKEILQSCEILGFSKENVEVLDDRAFQDSPRADWNMNKLKDILQEYIHMYKPDIILTFDDHGVSGHPNHQAVGGAVRLLYRSKKIPAPTTVLQLDTVNLARKYISVLDLPLSLATHTWAYVAPLSDVYKGQKAMLAHKSQMEWFRWLYIVFSRYMVINTYTQVSLEDT